MFDVWLARELTHALLQPLPSSLLLAIGLNGTLLFGVALKFAAMFVVQLLFEPMRIVQHGYFSLS
jgi:hypothetical protein